MVINTNTSANNATRLLAESTARLTKSLGRLTSGSKINSPEDDAAGLAVSLKFDAQINRNSAAKAIVDNAISYSQTRDGFLQKISKALDRMSELATLANDATKSTNDKANYTTEFTALRDYVSDIGTKDFNGVSLFNASGISVVKDSDGGTFSLDVVNVNTTDVTSVLAITQASASGAIATLKTAIENIATSRAKVGANISRLNLTSEQLAILNENLSASVSRIKDVDVAEETTQYARFNILVQSGTAMVAQANTLPQSALRLLS
jgi:flagellin